MELKLGVGKGIGFYIASCRAFLQGMPAKDDKPAKDPVEEVTLSALGNAINTAVAVAGRMEADKIGKITRVETNYPGIQSGNIERGVCQIRITLKRLPQ